MNVITVGLVKREDWLFKTSCDDDAGIILIVAYNLIFGHCIVRFFSSEYRAADWVDYLVMASKEGCKKE